MEVPNELRWVGPLFVILYFIFWGTRGFAPLLAILGHVLITVVIMLLLIPILIIIAFAIFNSRYNYAFLILCISFFFSGISIEPNPIPYYGPYPTFPPLPPSVAPPQPMYIVSPLYAILSFIFSAQAMYWYIPELAFAGFLLLIALALLSAVIMGLIAKGRIDAVRAMILFVSLIVCWTFSPILFLHYFGTHIVMTPVPIGPLVALNLLPWIPILKNESKYGPN